jgi:hypothetical protein
MKQATKGGGTAAKKTGGAALTDEQILELARAAVPKRLHGRERLVRRAKGTALAKKGQKDIATDVAELVGATLPPDDPTEATVEFVEETPLGKRNTVVHVRGGKVTNVVTRASRQ